MTVYLTNRRNPARRASIAALVLCGTSMLVTADASAQSGALTADAERIYDIRAGPLSEALNSFAEQAGVQLLYEAPLVGGRTSNGLSGRFTRAEALSRLLTGTGLAGRPKSDTIFSIVRATTGSIDLDPVMVRRVPDAVQVGPDNDQAEQRRRRDGSDTIVVIGERTFDGQVARSSSLGVLGDRDVFDTPFNVTSYTSDLIERQQAKTIGDIVANNPSVRNYFSGEAYQDQLTLRGFVLFNSDIAFNGLYGLNPNSSADAGAVERVDVFLGPSALLNGISPSGAIGGSINLVPKRALTTPTMNVTASYTSDSQFGGHVDLGRRFGEGDAFGVRVNGVYRSGGLGRDLTSQELASGRIALDFDRDGTRLSLDAGVQYSDTRASPGFIALGDAFVIPKAPPAKSNFNQPWERYRNYDRFAMVRGEHDLGDALTIYAAYGFGHSNAKWLAASTSLLDTTGNARLSTFTRSFFINKQSGEAGVRGKFATGSVTHRFTLAASVYYDKGGDNRVRNIIAPINTKIYNPVYVPRPPQGSVDFADAPASYYDRFVGLALADTLGFADDRILLTLGIRRQNVIAGSIDPTTGERSKDYDASAWTPLAGLLLKPTERLSFYANYIQGLQQGQIVEAPYVNATTVLPPFKSKQYELGAKYDFGGLGATVSIFQIAQPYTLATPAFAPQEEQTLTTNGEQRNRGIELNIFGAVTPQLRLLGGIQLLDGVYTKTQDGTFDGNRASGSPKTSINLGADWTLPFVPGVSVSARGIYTSTQVYDQTNLQSIPSWFTLDLGAGYQTRIGERTLIFRANVNNAFNKAYWSSTARDSLLRGAARSIRLSATVGL